MGRNKSPEDNRKVADPTEADEVDAKPESDQDKNWRKLEGRAKTAEERVAQLERQLAFTQAGLDHLTDKQVKALTAAHEGEITADTLKATAEELGFGAKPETGESTPAAEGPDHSGEASELAALANSPNGAELSAGGPLTQEQIDEKIRSFGDDMEAMDAWLAGNMHLFGR